jgi:AraC family transcriptional regulator
MLSVEIASLEPFEVVALRTEGLYPDVATTYIDLFNDIGGADNVRAILGIPHGNSENGLCGDLVFDCGFQLRAEADVGQSPCIGISISGGDYLLLRHLGSFRRLPETINVLYEKIIASDEVSFGDRPCLFHYLDDPERTAESELRTDVYVPVSLT